MDSTISELRLRGVAWDAIAAELCVSSRSVYYRAKRLNIAASGAVAKPRPVAPPRTPDPLPAGHAISWGLLTALTPSLMSSAA